MRKLLFALGAGLLLAAGAAGAESAAPAGARVYFISPQDGEVVSSPVTVRFGLQGMGVAPAGTDAPATGHHHLLIDAALPPLYAPVPKDARHLHFGGGQTEASVELPKGEHTLQLLFADRYHIPHSPPVISERITIRVE